MTCQYKESFLKGDGVEKIFECDEESITSKKYCVFHDEDFLKTATNSEIKALKEQFKTNVETQEKTGEIKCIGYRLPKMVLDVFSKDIPIYFTRAVFYGEVDFISKTFKKNISFAYAIFEKELDFTNTVFEDKVDFSRAISKQKSNFKSCKFYKHANFTAKIFFNMDFSNAIFHEEVNFTQGRIIGKQSNFSRTIFKKKSLFKSITFDVKNKF